MIATTLIGLYGQLDYGAAVNVQMGELSVQAPRIAAHCGNINACIVAWKRGSSRKGSSSGSV
jgi:hypothetical protein